MRAVDFLLKKQVSSRRNTDIKQDTLAKNGNGDRNDV